MFWPTELLQISAKVEQAPAGELLACGKGGGRRHNDNKQTQQYLLLQDGGRPPHAMAARVDQTSGNIDDDMHYKRILDNGRIGGLRQNCAKVAPPHAVDLLACRKSGGRAGDIINWISNNDNSQQLSVLEDAGGRPPAEGKLVEIMNEKVSQGHLSTQPMLEMLG